MSTSIQFRPHYNTIFIVFVVARKLFHVRELENLSFDSINVMWRKFFRDFCFIIILCFLLANPNQFKFGRKSQLERTLNAKFTFLIIYEMLFFRCKNLV